MAGKQRRHFFRVATDIAAECRLVDGFLAGPVLAVRVLDLSAGGAWLEVPELIARGQTLRIELAVDDPPLALRARGHVARRAEADGRLYVGIAFVGLEKRTKAEITRFVFAEARRTGQGAAYVQIGEAFNPAA